MLDLDFTKLFSKHESCPDFSWRRFLFALFVGLSGWLWLALLAWLTVLYLDSKGVMP